MRFDRNSIMAPLGRPSSVMGVRPILREPGLDMPERSIFEQPNPFLPPQTPITPPVNITGPVLPRMKPPIIPPKPPMPSPVAPIPPAIPPMPPRPRPGPVPVPQPIAPAPISIMGQPLSGADLELARSSGRGGLKGAFANIQEYIAQNPDKIRQGGGFLGKRFDEIPLEDRGFGPGIRRSEDFFRPEKLMMPSVPPSAPAPINIGGPALDTSLIPQREILERPPLQATPAPVLPPVVTPDPIIQPAPVEPAAVAPTAGAVPTQTQMPMGAIDPVLLQQQTSEKLTDPLIRSLYFGTQDSPGFFQQLQQAGSNLIGSDVPLQQTAGLSPLELLARQQAVAGIGGFEPFLQQNRDLVNQAIEQSRRAEGLQDPYYTQAEEIYKDTMGAYDPSMTQQFYNPYEDAVVQQTIEDVMKAGDKQDIAARAREISSGAFGGSRARLGAEERRQDLGEGLAKALSGIRQTGFTQAQSTGLGEFARQQAAKRTGAQGLMGIGVGRGSAASALGSQLAGYGSQIGGIGQTQEQMRAGQRGELAGFGGTGRGIAETGLGRIYEQQVGQQLRPLGVIGQIGSMLPGYQASQTQIDSGYGMPTDPSAAGLGAAFSAYGALAPRQGSS